MQRENEVQHVFLVGAKSLGAYGGYETFVYKLTEYHQNKKNIKYHVACKANGDGCMCLIRTGRSCPLPIASTSAARWTMWQAATVTWAT